jgi:hypothetical protein
VHADPAAAVALQFGPDVSQAAGGRDRQVPLVDGGRLAARLPELAAAGLGRWSAGRGRWLGHGQRHRAQRGRRRVRSGDRALAAHRRRPAWGGNFVDGDSSAVWTGRYLAVASGIAEPCPGTAGHLFTFHR